MPPAEPCASGGLKLHRTAVGCTAHKMAKARRPPALIGVRQRQHRIGDANKSVERDLAKGMGCFTLPYVSSLDKSKGSGLNGMKLRRKCR